MPLRTMVHGDSWPMGHGTWAVGPIGPFHLVLFGVNLTTFYLYGARLGCRQNLKTRVGRYGPDGGPMARWAYGPRLWSYGLHSPKLS